jgi:hypothetical protein
MNAAGVNSMANSALLVEDTPLARGSEIQGLVDNISPGRIFGWAWNQAQPSERLKIELRLGEEVVAETTADGERADLRSGGIGDGRHAFDLPLTPAFLERRAEIAIIASAADGGALSLPIRAARRRSPALSTVPKARAALPIRTEGGDTLFQAVEVLSGAQIALRERIESLAECLPVQGAAAAASSLLELEKRVETLETRCLKLDEQVAALRNDAAGTGKPPGRRLDIWQVGLGLVLGLAAGTALIWSLAGATQLILKS